MKKSFLLLAGVMVGGLALADNVTDKFPWIHEGYIYLTTKDSGSSSFGGSLKNWSDGKVPQPGHDYYSTKNGLRTPKGADETYTFGGDSITINAERRTDNPAADALTFKGVSPWKRYRVRPYVVDNGDGTATVKAVNNVKIGD